MEKLWLILISLWRYFVLTNAISDADIKNLGKFIHGVQDGLNTIKKYIPDEDGHCRFHCDDGAVYRENPNHVPTSNGCGSFGLQLDTRYMPGMKRCCDEHDICYDTCFKTKEECDTTFKECLMDMCKTLKFVIDEETVNTEFSLIFQLIECIRSSGQWTYRCSMATDVMYRSTAILGCKAYKESQKHACSCGYKTEASSSSRTKTSKETQKNKISDSVENSDSHEWGDSKMWMNAVKGDTSSEKWSSDDDFDSEDFNFQANAEKNKGGNRRFETDEL